VGEWRPGVEVDLVLAALASPPVAEVVCEAVAEDEEPGWSCPGLVADRDWVQRVWQWKRDGSEGLGA
jgi:hypothetical protein